MYISRLVIGWVPGDPIMCLGVNSIFFIDINICSVTNVEYVITFVISAQGKHIGGATEIKLMAGGNVNGLCEAVKATLKVALDNCDANMLLVFCAGTTRADWKVEATALDPGVVVNTVL